MKAKKITSALLLSFLAECGPPNRDTVILSQHSQSIPFFWEKNDFAVDDQTVIPIVVNQNPLSEILLQQTPNISLLSEVKLDFTSKTLFDIHNEAGQPLFLTIDEVKTYIAHHGTIDTAHLYAEVTTMRGVPVARTNNGGISLYVAEKGTLEDVLQLLAVSVPVTAQNESVSSKKREESVFRTWEDLALYKFVDGTKEQAEQLAAIRNKDGSAPFSTAQDYVYAAYVKANIQTIKALHALKDEERDEIFTTAVDLLTVASSYKTDTPQFQITENKIQELRKIKKASGTLLFTTVEDFFSVAGTDISYVELQELASITTDTGDDLFTTGADTVQYATTKKGMTYLEKLLDMRNPLGVQLFADGGYLASFVQVDGNLEQVQKLADILTEKGEPLLFPDEAIRYAALGFTEENLIPKETPNANALFFIAAHDYNQAFLNSRVKIYMEKFSKTYDLTLDFIGEDTTPEDEYKTLESYSLLFLAGHGDGKRMTLGNTEDERSYFDNTDKKFCNLLDTLPADAHIFVFSCYGGVGGESKDNFANYVAACAPGRTVIASMAPMSAYDITIETEYPITAKIEVSERRPYNINPRTNKEQKNDVTYVAVKPLPTAQTQFSTAAIVTVQ